MLGTGLTSTMARTSEREACLSHVTESSSFAEIKSRSPIVQTNHVVRLMPQDVTDNHVQMSSTDTQILRCGGFHVRIIQQKSVLAHPVEQSKSSNSTPALLTVYEIKTSKRNLTYVINNSAPH